MGCEDSRTTYPLRNVMLKQLPLPGSPRDVNLLLQEANAANENISGKNSFRKLRIRTEIFAVPFVLVMIELRLIDHVRRIDLRV